MDRAKAIEEQLADIRIDEETNRRSLANMRNKGMEKEMLMNFFTTVQSLAKMESNSTDHDHDYADKDSEDGCLKTPRPPTPGPHAQGAAAISSDDERELEGEEEGQEN